MQRSFNGSRFPACVRGAAIVCATALLCSSVGSAVFAADTSNGQTARLFELQASFHRASSVHDWIDGDTRSTIDQRIVDMLDLWTADGTLHLEVGGPNDGFYDFRGPVSTAEDVEDPALCPVVTGAAGAHRGTLCTFFRYVAGSFRAGTRIVSLSPSYKTAFHIHGNTAEVYFECHYFNADPAAAAAAPWPPRAGLPVWTPTGSQVVASGTAVKRGGHWLFSHLDAPLASDAALDPPIGR